MDYVSNIEQTSMKVCISNRFHIYNKITEPVPTNTFSQRAKHFRHNIKHMTTHLKTKHVKQLTDIVTKHDRPSSSATNIWKKGHVTNMFDFIFDFIFELIFLTATISIIFFKHRANNNEGWHIRMVSNEHVLTAWKTTART